MSNMGPEVQSSISLCHPLTPCSLHAVSMIAICSSWLPVRADFSQWLVHVGAFNPATSIAPICGVTIK